MTDYSTTEGEAVTLSVGLSAATETEVAVEVITIAGTATGIDFNTNSHVQCVLLLGLHTAGDDFSPASTRVTFLPGASASLSVMIQTLDNTVLEATEYFTVELISYFPRVSTQQGTSRANVTIVDDDGKHHQYY